MRRRIAALRIPWLAAPILSVVGHKIVVTLPPDGAVGAQGDVSEDGIFFHRFDGVGIGVRAGARGDAEEARFRIDRPQAAVSADPQPRDIIADGMNFPARHARRRH